MSTAKLPPIETIYVNNINDRVSINKTKSLLLSIFNKYGEILNINVKSNLAAKGQAFITFTKLDSAKKAQKENTSLFGKPLKVAFAKTQADIKSSELDIALRKELKKKKNEKIEKEKVGEKVTKKRKRPDAPKAVKKPKLDFVKLPPNRVLLLQNISPSISEKDLLPIFENLQGFITIRFIKVRNLAFIEFDSEVESKICLDKIDSNSLKTLLGEEILLTYAKK